MSVAEGVGARIRDLRERRDLRQRELGDLVGRTQAAISSWESGQREPGLRDLLALSRALGVEVGELFVGVETERTGRAVLRAQMKDLVREELVAEIEAFAAEAEREAAPQKARTVEAMDPAGAAREMLAAMHITRPPVRLPKLVRGCGVRLLGWQFHPEVSGLLMELEGGPVIGFNAAEPESRQRFSIAHELGHYVLRHRKPVHVDLAVSPSSHGEPPGYDWRNEREANAFATELLMPEDLVRAAAVERPDRHRLARLFKVSDEAMGFRLVNLGLH
jgi:Zn-dependent peptidase ImmA (M78 family)/DNA-binding XRE family transcriptional regulator